MTTIIQTGESTFTTDNGRGTTMTLSFNEKLGMWQMTSDNAARRAWKSLGVKLFASLQEVERSYKTWRGITALVA